MMKYNKPNIRITRFLKESVVTDSEIQSPYIDEIQALFGTMSPSEYKARIEKSSNAYMYE